MAKIYLSTPLKAQAQTLTERLTIKEAANKLLGEALEREEKRLNTKEEQNMITLIELQDVLGKQIEKCTDEHLTAETRALVFDQAKNVAKLAKQVINNADIILRADKMSARHDRIDRVVGE